MKYTLNLNLEEDDYKSLAYLAGNHNMDVSELIENFVNDLIDGSHTNGSDERMYAEQWFERCWFTHEPQDTLLSYLTGSEELTTFFEERAKKEENRKSIEVCEKTVHEIEEKLTDSDEWKNYYRELDSGSTTYYFTPEQIVKNDDGTYSCPLRKGFESVKYTPAYRDKEAYIQYLCQLKADYLNELEENKEELDTNMLYIKEDFHRHMHGKEYDWDEETAKVIEWYEKNMA